MARGLRQLTRRRLTPAQTQQIFNRFKDMDDRTCAVILGAMLDHSLERLVLLNMRPLEKNVREQLFSGTGPLSSFSSKIRVAAGFGIIGGQIAHDLEALNEIRNAFAHSSHQVTFRKRLVSARIETLHIGPVVNMLMRALRGPAARFFTGTRGHFLLGGIGLVKLMDDARMNKRPKRLECLVHGMDEQ